MLRAICEQGPVELYGTWKKKKLIALQFKVSFCLSKLVEKKCFFRAFTGSYVGVITGPSYSKSIMVDVQLSLLSALPWKVIYTDA